MELVEFIFGTIAFLFQLAYIAISLVIYITVFKVVIVIGFPMMILGGILMAGTSLLSGER